MIIHSLKIGVSAYQKQLLTVMLGPSPYKANYKNTFGKMIFHSYGKGSPKAKQQFSDGLFYEIIIPSNWVERHGLTFPDKESIDDFIETLDKQFKSRLYTYIEGVLDFKNNYNKLNKAKLVAKMKDAACCFLEKNGFNEDLVKFETIKKGYQRYLKNRESLDRVA